MTIYSITFAVNGAEQVVHDGEALQAMPGDQVRITEVEICVAGAGAEDGEACVDVAPLGSDGEEIRSQAGGTHLTPVPSGFGTIAGPDTAWTVGEGWQGFIAVLNHWVPGVTADTGCAGGRCERDDYLAIPLP